LIARKDFHNPEKRKGFLLDVEAKPNETAYLHGNEVKILEKHADKYVVLTTSNEKLEAPLEDVEKIGGHFPLVVVVFDDGAEVYKSLTTQYSNDGKTEVLVNIPEECQDMTRYCAWLGTTCGGRAWPNTREVSFYFHSCYYFSETILTLTVTHRGKYGTKGSGGGFSSTSQYPSTEW
jgi:hypothetical protein